MIQSSWIRQVLLLFLQFCSGLFSHACPQFMSFAKKMSRMESRHATKMLIGNDLNGSLVQIWATFSSPSITPWQTANAGHIWLGNWRDQSLWWSELSKSVDPHFGNWLRDHVGAPGRCSQHEHGIVKDNQFTEAYKLQLSKEVQDIPCELQVGFTESDHWRTPLHRMARTLPHLRTQRGQARCLLQKSHWWRVACDLIGKRFPIVTVMIGVLEIGNDNLN